jgi:Ni/Co efflux regulator RcnB
MFRSAILIATIIIVASTMPPLVGAQTAPSTTEKPMTGMKPDRTVGDKAQLQAMREKEAALKKKRAECSKQAKAQKVPVTKRRKFIHDCMSR